MLTFLEALAGSCAAAASAGAAANGSLAVGVFTVPGWQDTEPAVNASTGATTAPARFPPFSRVNHAKYVVTDRRVNIGTSNMDVSYFYQTAGASFNSDGAGIRTVLQSAFDRDWHSSYTTPLQEFNF